MLYKLDENLRPELVLVQLDREPLAGRLWIVDEHRIRIHRVGDDQV
jgi:hypothetical protein